MTKSNVLPVAEEEETVMRSSHRHNWIKGVLGILFLLACCSAAFWWGANMDSRVRPNGGLIVNESHLNFGEVWETDKFEITLPIQNPTEKNVQIARFDSTCGCASITPSVAVQSATLPFTELAAEKNVKLAQLLAWRFHRLSVWMLANKF
jgi:hypothetical protein